MCVLGAALAARGHDVTLLTTPDFGRLGEAFGLHVVQGGPRMREMRAMAGFPKPKGSIGVQIVSWLRWLRHSVSPYVVDLLALCHEEMGRADIVVYGPIAFFAGRLAGEAGLPSVRVLLQPLSADWRIPLPVTGARGLGPLLNRLTYESPRILTVALAPAFKRFRAETGAGRTLRSGSNPLRPERPDGSDVLAWSPLLWSPPGGAGPAPTGFLFADEPSGSELTPELDRFLDGGAPAIYVTLGSVGSLAQRSVETVLRAVTLWGGRALVSSGLKNGGTSSADVFFVDDVDHARLFPKLAGIVHHGGVGTTAASLRFGLPSVVCPLFGDQFFWGKRLAELGAAEQPTTLRRASAEQLAGRLDRVGRLEAAARSAAEAIAAEAGLARAIDAVETAGTARAAPAP